MNKNDPFRITVNDRHTLDVGPDEALRMDKVPDGEGRFHILVQGRAYQAEVVSADFLSRTYTLRLNGETFTVKIADYYDRLVDQLGLKIGGAQKENKIKAPMPGLVLQILAEPGQEVRKGDPLLILEAMKMENVIKAAAPGRIKTIAVQKGAAVDKGTLLLEME